MESDGLSASGSPKRARVLLPCQMWDEANGAKVAQEEIGEGRAAFFIAMFPKKIRSSCWLSPLQRPQARWTSSAQMPELRFRAALKRVTVTGCAAGTSICWPTSMQPELCCRKCSLVKEGYLLQNRFGRWPANLTRLRAVCSYQACSAGLRRMDGHHLWRSGHSRLRALPAGCAHEHAQKRSPRHKNAAGGTQSSPSRWPMMW